MRHQQSGLMDSPCDSNDSAGSALPTLLSNDPSGRFSLERSAKHECREPFLDDLVPPADLHQEEKAMMGRGEYKKKRTNVEKGKSHNGLRPINRRKDIADTWCMLRTVEGLLALTTELSSALFLPPQQPRQSRRWVSDVKIRPTCST